MKIFILAGGYGTRLKSVSGELPKCLVEIAGKPQLDYVLGEYKAVDDFFAFHFLLGYRSDKVIAHLEQDFQTSFSVSCDSSPSGTGTALINALGHDRDYARGFLIANADTWISASRIRQFLKSALLMDSDIVILASKNHGADEFHNLALDSDKNFIGVVNQASLFLEHQKAISSGLIYFKNAEWLQALNLNCSPLSIESLLEILSNDLGLAVKVDVQEFKFYDLGTLPRLNEFKTIVTRDGL